MNTIDNDPKILEVQQRNAKGNRQAWKKILGKD